MTGQKHIAVSPATARRAVKTCCIYTISTSKCSLVLDKISKGNPLLKIDVSLAQNYQIADDQLS